MTYHLLRQPSGQSPIRIGYFHDIYTVGPAEAGEPVDPRERVPYDWGFTRRIPFTSSLTLADGTIHLFTNDTPYYRFKNRSKNNFLTAESEAGLLVQKPSNPSDKGQWWAQSTGFGGQSERLYTAAFGPSRVMTIAGPAGNGTRLKLAVDQRSAIQNFAYDSDSLIKGPDANYRLDGNGTGNNGLWPVVWNSLAGSQYWDIEDVLGQVHVIDSDGNSAGVRTVMDLLGDVPAPFRSGPRISVFAMVDGDPHLVLGLDDQVTVRQTTDFGVLDFATDSTWSEPQDASDVLGPMPEGLRCLTYLHSPDPQESHPRSMSAAVQRLRGSQRPTRD
ncbi:hypothetical protein AB0H73_39415 [Streptomyces olivoreticuli]